MTRTVTAAVVTEVQKAKTRPILFVEMDFTSGFVRMWTGIGDFSWDGKTWNGVGDLLGISPVEETDELRSAGLVVQLSGIPSALLATALGEDYQGRSGKVWLGFLDDDYVLIDDPVLQWAGRMDVMEIDEGAETSVISVRIESNFAALKRANERRYTREDLQIDFPGDKGLDFIAALQDKQLVW
ncbi:MAG: hypothetical protein IIB66_13285 [Proteobacteria bacterium]|nr:hypothetical protein [Pseudomonadota bacterium]